MSNKILILGKGFIGRRLQEGLQCHASHKNISSIKDAQSLIKKYQPKILINCIGHTGKRNVDDCELLPDKTLTANTFLPIILAEAALRSNIKLVHLSSGCIYHFDYSKQKPITEGRTPDYCDLYYSRTKIYAEQVLKELSQRYNVLIARIRVPLDDRPHPRNILTKLIKYQSVIDVPNSVTYLPDFIRALNYLIQKNATGIYNIALKGGLRYPKLLKIYQQYHPKYKYKVISLKNLNLVRTNLLLSTKKLEKSGFKVRSINSVLTECVEQYVKY